MSASARAAGRRRPPGGGRAGRELVWPAAAGALALAAGWACVHGHSKLFLLAGALVALATLALANRGLFVAAMVLASMDGIPFLDTSRIVFSKYTLEDAAICGLLGAGAIWVWLDNGSYRPTAAGTALSRCGVPLLAWYLFTLLRSLAQHVPLQHAAAYGRDFLYFSLLLIVMPRVRLSRRDIGAALLALALGASVFAAGQVLLATGTGNPGSLIHFEKTRRESGLVRVYASMTDLVDAGLAVAVGALLLARSRRLRWLATPVALLLLASVIVQLTRARWIGLSAGLLLAGVWVMLRGGSGSALLRRRLGLGAMSLAIVVLLLVVAAPGIVSGDALAGRLLSIFSDLGSGGGTVAVRETATHTLTGYVGGQWLQGLGFIPPSAHYFYGMPEGSIRDSDLGVLNALATMGAVGALLIYVPALLALAQSLRACATRSGWAWLSFGGSMWLAATLISSLTLVTLFSASGLALTAMVLALLVHPAVSGRPEQAHAAAAVRHPRRVAVA